MRGCDRCVLLTIYPPRNSVIYPQNSSSTFIKARIHDAAPELAFSHARTIAVSVQHLGTRHALQRGTLPQLRLRSPWAWRALHLPHTALLTGGRA